jgi:general secretion pathway protein K
LAAPWAVPLAEARLSSFLAADKNVPSDTLDGLPDAFLSGRIVDAQSKLNVLNLVANGKPDAASVAVFGKLFQLLGLPASEVDVLVSNLLRALPPTVVVSSGSVTVTTTSQAGNSPGTGPLLPWREDQLVWLGLSPATVAALAPYVTILPVRTALNINTASAEAIDASVPKLDLAVAQRLVAARGRSYFHSLADANALMREDSAQLVEGQHSIGSSYFEVHARLRLDDAWIEEQTLLQRNGLDVGIVWSDRGAGAAALPPGNP